MRMGGVRRPWGRYIVSEIAQNSTRKFGKKLPNSRMVSPAGPVTIGLVRQGRAMLLQCETDDGARGAGWGLAERWLHRETLESLVELNELCLALFAEQAAVRTAQASLLLPQVGELWRVLDAPARRRAAACPYLLVDAGFADPLRWRQPAPLGVGDAGEAAYGTFFTVAGATEVARLVFTYAWHLARSQSAAARLLLGMSAPCAALIGHHSLRQIHALAETHQAWLKPRWP